METEEIRGNVPENCEDGTEEEGPKHGPENSVKVRGGSLQTRRDALEECDEEQGQGQVKERFPKRHTVGEKTAQDEPSHEHIGPTKRWPVGFERLDGGHSGCCLTFEVTGLPRFHAAGPVDRGVSNFFRPTASSVSFTKRSKRMRRKCAPTPKT